MKMKIFPVLFKLRFTVEHKRDSHKDIISLDSSSKTKDLLNVKINKNN